MANIKSSEKSARQDEKRRAHRASVLTGIKSAQKRFSEAVASGNVESAKEAHLRVVSVLDKAAKRGVIHKNSASRRKSLAGKSLRGVAKD